MDLNLDHTYVKTTAAVRSKPYPVQKFRANFSIAPNSLNQVYSIYVYWHKAAHMACVCRVAQKK